LRHPGEPVRYIAGHHARRTAESRKRETAPIRLLEAEERVVRPARSEHGGRHVERRVDRHVDRRDHRSLVAFHAADRQVQPLVEPRFVLRAQRERPIRDARRRHELR
jgi:hypothetical protein